MIGAVRRAFRRWLLQRRFNRLMLARRGLTGISLAINKAITAKVLREMELL